MLRVILVETQQPLDEQSLDTWLQEWESGLFRCESFSEVEKNRLFVVALVGLDVFFLFLLGG